MTKLASRPRVLTTFAIAIWLLMSPAQSEKASAEGKNISGTGKFGPTLSQVILYPGDVPKHEVSLVTRLQSAHSAHSDWNNVALTQFVYTDYIDGTGYHRGHNADVHPGGDRTSTSYEGQTTRTANPDGSWESKFEGKSGLRRHVYRQGVLGWRHRPDERDL